MNQKGLAAKLVKLNHITHKIVLFIAQASILAMVAIVTLTVILRYCFNTGLSWAEEVPRLLVTVFAFIACAIGVRDHLHVAVNAVYNQLPVGGKARKALDVLTDVVVLLCGLFMLYTGGARTMKLFSMPGTLPMTDVGALAKPPAAPAMFTGRPMRKSSSACFMSRAVWKRL